MPMRRIVRAGATLLVVGAAAAGGAGCQGQNVAAGPQTVLLHVSAPLSEPVWSDAADELVGLTASGHRVETVEPALHARGAHSTLSAALNDVGRNIAPGPPDHDVVYVPQPASDDVAVLNLPDLKQVGTLPAGSDPSYVATDVGAQTLLALSGNGRTVTGVSLHDKTVSTTQPVDAEPEADIDGPQRERVVEFHVTGSDGIDHYLAGARRGSIDIPTTDAVGDETKVTRLYVAETGTDRLVAVDSGRAGGGMDRVGQARLDAPVLFVDDDAHRIYAATHDQLVIMETRSYGGFPGGKIPVIETVNFRSDLPAAVRDAALSGVVSGTDRVFLTFSDAPYVLSVAKPNV
jgi:hypothetical protein